MKYKTFRGLLLGGGIALGAIVVIVAVRPRAANEPVVRNDRTTESAPAPVENPPPPAAGQAQAQTPTLAAIESTAGETAASGGEGPLRPLDQQILAAAQNGIAGAKQKDAIAGPAKVDLYRDPGETAVNRAKVDLNRNGKWDERWTFGAKGSIKRQVAPADDENYTEEYRLRAGVWVQKR